VTLFVMQASKRRVAKIATHNFCSFSVCR